VSCADTQRPRRWRGLQCQHRHRSSQPRPICVLGRLSSDHVGSQPNWTIDLPKRHCSFGFATATPFLSSITVPAERSRYARPRNNRHAPLTTHRLKHATHSPSLRANASVAEMCSKAFSLSSPYLGNSSDLLKRRGDGPIRDGDIAGATLRFGSQANFSGLILFTTPNRLYRAVPSPLAVNVGRDIRTLPPSSSLQPPLQQIIEAWF
jgi:hypothetical protein